MSFWSDRRRAVAAAPSNASAAAALALRTVTTQQQTPSVTEVYRMIEAADKKNKILAADPRRSLHRTLVQRRHFQGLREVVAQVERARQAEMLRQMSYGFGCGSVQHYQHQQEQKLEESQLQQQCTAAAAATPMMGITRPAHFNPALLNNTKNTHGWPSNQWTASPTVSVVASIGDSDVVAEPEVTFSSDASSSFEQAWFEATNESNDADVAPTTAPSFRLPLGTAGTTASPATPTTTITFNLPCGTAGLFQTQEVNTTEFKQQKPIAAPTMSSSRRGEKRMDGDDDTDVVVVAVAPSRSFSSVAPFSHVAKKKCQIDSNFVADDDDVDNSASGRIGFASSPFQWQQLFDPSQLQQVLCN